MNDAYDSSGNVIPNKKDLNLAKKEIDRAIATGSTIIFMIYKVENSNDPLAVSTNDFKELVEYVGSLVFLMILVLQAYPKGTI